MAPRGAVKDVMKIKNNYVYCIDECAYIFGLHGNN
jgi:hypothetical protein